MLRLADGRIIVAGSETIDERAGSASFYGITSTTTGAVAVARYAATGTVDTTFGLGGFVAIDADGTAASALAVEAGGELLVGNTVLEGPLRRLQVMRLDADGFPTGDAYRHPAVGDDQLTALLVQPDGKVVVAGNVTGGGVRRILVLRLNGDLTLDTGGLVSGLAGEEIEAFALARESDGRILVGGRHRVGLAESVLVMRLAADLSTTDGIATVLTSTIGRPVARAVVVEPAGTIVAAGTAAGGASDDAIVLRLATDLTLTSHTLVGSNSTDGFRGLARESDGKLVAVGTAGTQGNDVLCTRFNADLTIDDTFDAGDLPRGKGIHEGVAVAIQPDDKALVLANAAIDPDPEGGYDTFDYLSNNVALFRLVSDGSLDPSFTETVPSHDRPEVSLATTAIVADTGGAAVFAMAMNDYLLPVQGATADDFVVGRVDGNGALDTSFGTNGFTRISFGAIDRPAALLRQSDGAYVVAGAKSVFDDSGFISTTIDSFAVARLAADGSLDPTFGSGGTLTHQFSGSAEATATALVQQADGKIIAAGAIENTFDVALARYTAAGVLDGTFGSGGRRTGPIRCISSPVIGLQSDGKLVVACGGTDMAGLTSQLSVARYTNGTLDAMFGTAGVTVVDMDSANTYERAKALFVRPDDSIVIAGSTQVIVGPATDDFFLVRLDAGGALDGTFGAGGIVTTDLAVGADDFLTDAVQQGDGKLVLFGHSFISTAVPAIVRYDSTGVLDAGFGAGGIRLDDSLPAGALPNRAALASDGAIVAGASHFPDFVNQGSGAATLSRFFAGTCGNVVTEPGEVCDDGNPTSGDGCDANCTPTACGNGIVAGAETCDDGNATAGDCCDAGCQLESDGATCAGAGLCTTGTTCTAGVCGGGTAVTCGACERCDAETGCVADLRASCRSTDVLGASALQIKDSPIDAKDQLQWQIKKGDFLLFSEYGDPVPDGGDDYALCVFDVSGLEPKILVASAVPAGGICQNNPCWTATDDTLAYKEKTGANGGVTQIKMKAGDEISSQSLKGKGAGLALPKMSLPSPLRVQLQSENGACFEDAYVTPKTNSYKQYKAAGEF
ncbi:MAG: hypothetical protein IT293_02570 [Deltaproteobacteria bacterium]|nr:hypothetical protein [Deltaproteobacteria bacterium]